MTGPCKFCKNLSVCVVLETMSSEEPESEYIWGCDAFSPPDIMSKENLDEWETYAWVEWDTTRSKIEKIRESVNGV